MNNITLNVMDKKQSKWSMALGTYPGILFGARTYEGPTHTQHVLYLPFVDIAIEIEH
jgi:hypothetical protein